MADETYEDSVVSDLRAHLTAAKIPLEQVSTLAKQGDDQLKKPDEKTIKLVKDFLSENIQIQSSGPEARQSQLYIACFWGIRDVVRQLLQTGADPNKQNKGSLWTALHAATFQEHGPVVMVLLENAAQPELPDSEGRTPKDFASASDKIWPLFAALQLERTPRAELINKHIIRKGPMSNASSQPGYGIKMAEYSGKTAEDGDRYAAAAMMGDVLADDFPGHQGMDLGQQSRVLGHQGMDLGHQAAHPGRAGGRQPNFSPWQ